MDKNIKKIIIIGGGPAGMMAAITAAGEGRSVVVLEHGTQPGKKILATGNGRCNFTNKIIAADCYNSNGSFAMKVIDKFDNERIIEFFKGLGVISKEKNGFIYPQSEQAQAIQQVLIRKMKSLAIDVITGINVTDIGYTKEGYRLSTDNGTMYADRLIIACGLYAAPKTGSDGTLLPLIKKLGINVNTPLPALTALRSRENIYKSLAGIRCDARVSICDREGAADTSCGELQLTDYGISGIPVFQISSHAVRIIEKNKKVKCIIDFVPFMSREELKDYIKQRAACDGDNLVYALFYGLLNNKLTDALTPLSTIKKNTPLKLLTEGDIERMVNIYKSFTTEMTGYNGFDYAQVCQGGVDVNEISAATMESTKCKNLYFAGEVADVDGKCGGYNLTWAFSSGYVAGKAAADD